MADWDSGLEDDDAKDKMPMLASPITQSGQDPDMVRLRMMQGGLIAPQGQPGPVNTTAAPQGMPAASTVGSAGLNQTGRDALARAMAVGQQETDTANKEGQVNPKIAALTQQRDQDASMAPNAADYKPGFGTRVLRGLRGLAIGAASGGIPGAALGALDPGHLPGGKGYSDPTDAYDTALAMNKKVVAGDDTGLADAQALFKQQQDARAAQEKGLGDAASTFGRVSTDASGLENADTSAAKLPIDQQNADTAAQTANNNSPGAKLQLSDQQLQQRTVQAGRLGLKGENRLLYVLNGKVPDPRQATAEEIASQQAMRAFVTEHGRAPNTVAEFQTVQQAARGATGAGAGGGDANLRQAARLASARVKDLQDQKGKMNLLGQWTADDEKKLADATTESEDFQRQMTQGAKGAAPPDSLLAQYKEGDPVYGQNGEVWTKKNGKWTQ